MCSRLSRISTCQPPPAADTQRRDGSSSSGVSTSLASLAAERKGAPSCRAPWCSAPRAPRRTAPRPRSPSRSVPRAGPPALRQRKTAASAVGGTASSHLPARGVAPEKVASGSGRGPSPAKPLAWASSAPQTSVTSAQPRHRQHAHIQAAAAQWPSRGGGTTRAHLHHTVLRRALGARDGLVAEAVARHAGRCVKTNGRRTDRCDTEGLLALRCTRRVARAKGRAARDGRGADDEDAGRRGGVRGDAVAGGALLLGGAVDRRRPPTPISGGRRAALAARTRRRGGGVTAAWTDSAGGGGERRTRDATTARHGTARHGDARQSRSRGGRMPPSLFVVGSFRGAHHAQANSNAEGVTPSRFPCHKASLALPLTRYFNSVCAVELCFALSRPRRARGSRAPGGGRPQWRSCWRWVLLEGALCPRGGSPFASPRHVERRGERASERSIARTGGSRRSTARCSSTSALGGGGGGGAR
eukprot:scaffold724_cov333-Prasinococcus_capsulatus_cf.AAC.10